MIRLKYTFCLLVVALLSLPLRGAAWHANEEGVILVISSYNPDTKRMSSFLSVFEKKIAASNIPYNIYIENLESKGMTDAAVWEKTVAELIHRYEQKNLKAASPVAVRTFPHIKTGLCTDDAGLLPEKHTLLRRLRQR